MEFAESEWAVCQLTDPTINKTVLGFDHPSFDEYRHYEAEHDKFIKTPFRVEEGVMECNRCKSKKVFSTSAQTRASDESLTVFCLCTACGEKWAQNG